MIFGRLKFRGKILVFPILAIAGFLLLFILDQLANARGKALMMRIETGYYPSLELSRDLEQMLEEAQRGLHDAVAASEIEGLSATDAIHEKILQRLEQGRGNPTINVTSLDQLRVQLNGYFTLARTTSARLIRKESGEQLTTALETMRQQYNDLREKLRDNTSRDKKEMAAALASVESFQQASRTAGTVIILFFVVLFGLVSLSIIRGLTTSLAEVAARFARLSAGDLPKKVEIES